MLYPQNKNRLGKNQRSKTELLEIKNVRMNFFFLKKQWEDEKLKLMKPQGSNTKIKRENMEATEKSINT